ncbi:bacillithiol biosynthesis deacetylase BshB1 [Bacillus horti]|uniref:Bacillithiol biosynthesis deacetylase BshB1 n=1 Tax=Caldalkalibacillus horti TaxID=77523 RepID=A0ABT9VX93_9BACI|nr:bacillithiol biosynthesis deacetylase BshB1 [Bacillus horti]MDQ0165499.1 bacillithiol biosynthesis deacetylase BshB1 [Bacillus horti]
MSTDHLDILCFGAHPDDVEIGMAGTILKHVAEGYKVGICDLTMAELSSNGTVTKRQEEAQEAANRLGVVKRVNLGFPDRGLASNRDAIAYIVRIIREHKPRIVFLPFEEDRHPDHGAVTHLVEEAIFNAGIQKYQMSTEEEEAHRVQQTYYYFINGIQKPDILVDITKHVEGKKSALLAYESQFLLELESTATRLNDGFIEFIEGRDRVFGKMKNVPFAEGFVVKEPLLISTLL